MIKIKSSESFGFENSQEKKICISEGSHTMNKNATSSDVLLRLGYLVERSLTNGDHRTCNIGYL